MSAESEWVVLVNEFELAVEDLALCKHGEGSNYPTFAGRRNAAYARLLAALRAPVSRMDERAEGVMRFTLDLTPFGWRDHTGAEWVLRDDDAEWDMRELLRVERAATTALRAECAALESRLAAPPADGARDENALALEFHDAFEYADTKEEALARIAALIRRIAPIAPADGEAV